MCPKKRERFAGAILAGQRRSCIKGLSISAAPIIFASAKIQGLPDRPRGVMAPSLRIAGRAAENRSLQPDP
jgi:hypothetical protein